MDELSKEIELEEQNLCLKALIKMVEFSVTSKCCPVCGGYQHHDSACLLAAALYPEYSASYKRETGGDTFTAAMSWKIENEEKYKFLQPA